MGKEIEMAVYRPKKGKQVEFSKLIRAHFLVLRKAGLVTARRPIVVQSRNGIYVEIFEWKSKAAASKAHKNPVVAKIWERMAAIGNFETLQALDEAGKPFPHFSLVGR